MRLWILFACGVLILGAAIWPFGKRTEQLAPAPVSPAVAVKPATPAPPKPEPAKIVEVIDLARAYEPVREPDEPAGSVNPATFIELQEQPKPIPPAGELIDVLPRELTLEDRLRRLRELNRLEESPPGGFELLGQLSAYPSDRSNHAPIELIKVMPRELK